MPRPSLTDVRTAEILDAFAACVARYGLDGATLERIAQTAGVKRPILRHYLGNRAEMIDKLVDHVLARFDRATNDLISTLPESGRLDELLDLLFHENRREPSDASIFQAFVGVAARYPKIRQGVFDFVAGFEAAVTKEVADAYPKADPSRCRVAGAGITAIYFNVAAVGPLGPPERWIATQRQAADALVEGL